MLVRSLQTRPAAVALTAAALASLALGACGGSGKTGGSSTGAASATAASRAATASAPGGAGGAAFIARADAVCRRLNDRLSATAPHAGEPTAAIARNAVRHAALERRTTSELRSLVPPGALARDWTRIVAYRRVLAADLVTLAHMLDAGGNPQTSGLLAAKSAAHAAMTAIASHDGFADCTKVGSA